MPTYYYSHSLNAKAVLIALVLAASFVQPVSAQTRDFGVDVSHYQGDSGISQARWNQMFTTDGKRFAFVKATESLSVVDVTMPDNMTRATAAGLRAGVYHYGHPELHPTPAGAAQEADFFLSKAGNFIGPGYLRPVLDLESGSSLTPTDLTTWVLAFANEIVTNRGAGAAPIIYTLQYYANSGLDSRLADYDLWISTTGSGADPAVDDPPGQGFATATGVFNNWSFWQYDGNGSAGGISPVDLDVCHSEFKSLDSFLIPAMPNPVAPAIATQPLSRTVRVGNSASLSVAPTVSSSTPLSFQWRFNGTDLAGATATDYIQTNVQLSASGSYTVVITNVAGSITSAVATLTVLPPPPPVPPVVLYQENFDEYPNEGVVSIPTTANGFNILFGAASGPVDFLAGFGFDYSKVSSPTTIPPAPYSTNGTTKGLFLTVNKDATAAAAAVNLYPVSETVTGNYALKFDLWINYPNTFTATEHALFGINHSGSILNRVGQATSDGLFFAVDGDGGVAAGATSLRDFAVFQGGGDGVSPRLLTTGNTVFEAASLLGPNFDNADAGFMGLFPSKTLPSFTTAPGTAGNGWVSVEVRQVTNVITWFLNDTVVAQYTNSSPFTNGDILIGYNDAFSSIGGADNFAVFDNIRVETLPDLDGNGLADAWEMQYFGQTGVDPDADADGDGASNLQEYQAGTNPTNAASAFRILSALPTGNSGIAVTWTTVGGHSYVLQGVTNDTGSLTTNFVDLSPLISVPGTNEGTTNYVHVGAATNRAAYYRVRLVP